MLNHTTAFYVNRIEKLESLTEDDLEDIRRKRIQEMKLKQQQMQLWKLNVSLSIELLK